VSLRRPIYLLADSRLLFRASSEDRFLEELRAQLPKSETLAAYVGASNGDDPAFFELFDAAMEALGVSQRKFVRASYGEEDAAALAQADLILLAGGDVSKGWRTLSSTGMKEVLVRRYLEGATLVGVSAGAVQLGWGYLSLVPYRIGAHEEREGWKALRAAAREGDTSVRAVGIPFGGGMIFHPDHTVEAVRFPLNEFCFEDGALAESLCLPPPSSERTGTTGGRAYG
jgi:hypothetical protein